MVRRRRAQRRLQLRRPPRRGRQRRQGGHPLRRRARRRHPRHHVRRPARARCSRRRTRCRTSASARATRVAIYLPMIPEAAVAMLACARIGAPHSVVFGGFSAEALLHADQRRRGARSSSPPTAATGAGRAVGAQAGGRRGPRRRARRRSSTCSSSSAPGRTPSGTSRDVWWHEALDAGQPTPMRRRAWRRSTRSSSSTRRARPGSRRASSTPPAATSRRPPTRTAVVHDVHPETDVYWCTADIGWVTGHSLHRLRTAGQRRDAGDVRGHARTPRTRAAGGRSSRSTR